MFTSLSAIHEVFHQVLLDSIESNGKGDEPIRHCLEMIAIFQKEYQISKKSKKSHVGQSDSTAVANSGGDNHQQVVDSLIVQSDPVGTEPLGSVSASGSESLDYDDHSKRREELVGLRYYRDTHAETMIAPGIQIMLIFYI